VRDRIPALARWVVALAALVVIVVGLAGGGAQEGDPALAVAAKLKCPACQSESLADSATETARDLRTFIAEEVAAGRSEQQIIDGFVARYGESILLDPPASGRGLVLWLLPAGVLVVGVSAILTLRRPRRATTEVAP
jgi:cytochrome c-type biogenesis protein CcmH